ncbi:MAG: pyridoxamine 5'-phosphate oxidase family protein [Clostridiales bacterium]|jgi:hypothetical protein|nr:pyridoxamine 5'-phosphate oxidase family protein [Clostridiales bacterium]
MTELIYTELEREITEKLESLSQITLATCAGDRVYARTVCPINDELTIYLGTSGKSEKAIQILGNGNVALAVDNIQIEAVAENIGHPSKHPAYTAKYAEKFPQYVTQYHTESEDIVVLVKPSKITLYKFFGKACEDILDIEKGIAYRIDL